MAEPIEPVSMEMRLAQILGDDYLAQAPGSIAEPAPAVNPAGTSNVAPNAFEDVLSSAISALNDVSRTEIYANQLVDGYIRGEVELHEVMLAQSKMTIMVQLAVTTINTAVSTFKEITQMQI